MSNRLLQVVTSITTKKSAEIFLNLRAIKNMIKCFILSLPQKIFISVGIVSPSLSYTLPSH